MRRRLAAFPVFLALFSLTVTGVAGGQPPAPRSWQSKTTAPRDPLPPLPAAAAIRTVSGEGPTSARTLPNEQGQVWKEYDIRPYTGRLSDQARPEQSIVDWILRETGTDVWFSESLGLLNADRTTLRVYHTPEIQAVVADIVERFVRSETANDVFAIRLLTVTSPNWRSKALPLMRPVTVQSPGVEAWLISRENAAVVLSNLRKRTDYREHNSPNLLIRNGESHEIRRSRPVAYIRSIGQVNAWGGYQMDMGQVEEGFDLRLSPLLTLNAAQVDAVIKVDTSQVEKLTPIMLPAPTVQNPRQTAQIQVPQTSSWRLHERFRWPANEVLLISCGVVATPGPERPALPGLPPALGPRPPRADALVFVEAKGRAGGLVEQGERPQQTAGFNYRGRY